jgi:hypothetical protein
MATELPPLPPDSPGARIDAFLAHNWPWLPAIVLIVSVLAVAILYVAAGLPDGDRFNYPLRAAAASIARGASYVTLVLLCVSPLLLPATMLVSAGSRRRYLAAFAAFSLSALLAAFLMGGLAGAFFPGDESEVEAAGFTYRLGVDDDGRRVRVVVYACDSGGASCRAAFDEREFLGVWDAESIQFEVTDDGRAQVTDGETVIVTLPGAD